MKKNVVLKERKVFEEDNHLYLKLVYEYEDDHGAYELIIPKIDLEIHTDLLPTIEGDGPLTGPGKRTYCKIRLDSNIFNLIRSDVKIEENGVTMNCKNAFCIVNSIREKPKEMTIADIEKKLGYKVKLVSEDSKK